MLAIGIAVAVAFLVRAFLFEIILVDGPSMQPTLHTDERLAVEKVSRYAGLPERGDIIIVHYSDGTNNNYVKRAIGLPGETVEIRDSTVLYQRGSAERGIHRRAALCGYGGSHRARGYGVCHGR